MIQDVENAARKKSAESQLGNPSYSATRRVLVVDDDEGDLELASLALEIVGVADEVRLARNADEALVQLDQLVHVGGSGTSCLVLLDVKMPQVDGHELLARIRKLGFKNSIVMLSGSGIANDIERAYETGANGYLVKPIRFDELVELLRDTCAFWLTANRLG